MAQCTACIGFKFERFSFKNNIGEYWFGNKVVDEWNKLSSSVNEARASVLAAVFPLPFFTENDDPITVVITGYHTYTWNNTAHTERVEEEILSVTYEDGRWSKPYFDCGGGNIWMMTYTVPFFGYANGSYYFKGTSGIDIDLRRVDIDQCPLPPGSTALNIFANSDKCKKSTTKCVTIPGLGFRRGSYKCECRMGFYFPDTNSLNKYYNGSIIEEEYEKKIMGEITAYDEEGNFECLACAEGCETCEDASPCVVTLHWVMRAAILTLAVFNIASLPVIVVFTWKYSNLKVIRAASPVLLCIIILGACFIYSTTLVLYPIPTIVTCSLRVWLREIGFSLAYGALMLKTWRISVIFRVRSAKAVKITDLDLMKRLGIIVGVFSVFLAIRTVVAPPHVIVSMTADDLKAFLCSTDWWDHVFTAMEMMFLVWGIRLCIMVRKAPSEFNESKYISLAIYNEFILSLFLNVSMLFLQSPANPDLLFIIFFCHTQLTITLLIVIIFGSKVYMVVKGQGKGGEETLSMTKPKAAKFLQRANQGNSNNHATFDQGDLQASARVAVRAYCSGCSCSDAEGRALWCLQEQFQRLYTQLESLREKNLRLGNRQMVAKLTAMQEAAKNTTTTTVSSVTTAIVTEKNGRSAEQQQQQQPQQLLLQPHQQQRRRSQRERKYSDGIVMKPYVNSILANMTDNITCTSFQGEGETPISVVCPRDETRVNVGVKNVNLLRKSVSKEEILDKGGGRQGNGFCHLRKSASKDENINSVIRNKENDVNVFREEDHIDSSLNKNRRRSESHLKTKTDCKDSSVFSGFYDGAAAPSEDCDLERGNTKSDSVDHEPADTPDVCSAGGTCQRCVSQDNCSSNSSSSENPTRVHSSSKDLRSLGHRSAEFLLQSSVSTELSERVCRSLEYLDETGTRCGGTIGGSGVCGGPEEDLSIEDRSVRSAHSTPRRSQGRRFREVRDPDRARAFILYNLSDRATLTDEVTV
ncbi:metabotropic glutamate receptor-like protein P [Cherax quadricarinatus]